MVKPTIFVDTNIIYDFLSPAPFWDALESLCEILHVVPVAKRERLVHERWENVRHAFWLAMALDEEGAVSLSLN